MSEYDPLSDDPNGSHEQAGIAGHTPDSYERRFEPGSSTLGLATRQRRELLGITQEDVAQRFGGPSVASLRTIENGQADTYRAKTLLSLDSALAWPRGASMTVLTGVPDRLETQDWEFAWKSMFVPTWPLDAMEFDRFVNYIITTVSDEDTVKYDMPIRSASATTPDIAIRTVRESAEHVADKTGDPIALILDREALEDSIEDGDRFNRVLAVVATLSTDELDSIGHFAINFARLIRQFKKSTAKISIGGEEISGSQLRKYLLKVALETPQDDETEE